MNAKEGRSDHEYTNEKHQKAIKADKVYKELNQNTVEVIEHRNPKLRIVYLKKVAVDLNAKNFNAIINPNGVKRARNLSESSLNKQMKMQLRKRDAQKLRAKGMLISEIAKKLNVSPSTVHTYLNS